MSNIMPAGFSDSDSDSDDYGFYDKPEKQYYQPVIEDNTWKKIEDTLQEAIINENIGQVDEIIKKDLNGNVNSKLDSGWTTLMHASFHAAEKIVKYLLDNNADPKIHSDSVTPLMMACSNSRASEDTVFNIVMLMIEKGAFLNIGDKYGQTPLMKAIASGRFTVVKELLKRDVNIEMRDGQGWTALFWAVHNDQAEILEILIDHGARVNEVDKHDRSVIDIATTYDYQNIIEILNKHTKNYELEAAPCHLSYNMIRSWHDFYPGVKTDGLPKYTNEIPHLLHGMACENLTDTFLHSDMDLRSFLLLQDEDMEKLGIDLPYEKQRLKTGLKNFHLLRWKLTAVSGLYAKKAVNYSVIDCLTSLGNHLQQVYILEATLQYVLIGYKKNMNKWKDENSNSANVTKLREQLTEIRTYVKRIKKDVKNLQTKFYKMNKNNPPIADLIRSPSPYRAVVGTTFKLVATVTIGLIIYHSKTICNTFKK